jgi:hypothetical protein
MVGPVRAVPQGVVIDDLPSQENAVEGVARKEMWILIMVLRLVMGTKERKWKIPRRSWG